MTPAERPILVLDEGTTSTRAMLFARDGTVLGMAQRPLTQHYPAPGRVEHDPEEIWSETLAVARAMVEQAGGADRIAAIGITNQRETVIGWDRRSGRPIGPAIVWQDRRTADFCQELIVAGHEPAVQAQTGLVLDPYFSASKLRWLLDHSEGARDLGAALAFGTVDSWLIHRLTGGLHVTDATNASRTMLLDLAARGWDAGLAALFGVPLTSLPEIVDCAGPIAETSPELFGSAIPICGIAGDQQAATIGQACLAPGETKATFGTGAFILANQGNAVPRSHHRLLGTILSQIGGRRVYALEGSVFVAGSLVKWLRDQIGLIGSAADTAAIAAGCSDNGGVVMLPALAGLGAPHWRPDATGAIIGLTLGTTRAQLVRAAMESIAHQCHDLAEAFAADGAGWTTLRIDGGMSANDWLAQDLADMLDRPVERPADVETTARGAAMLAAVGAGLYRSLGDAAAAMASPRTAFTPALDPADRARRLTGWRRALATLPHVTSA